MGLLSLLSLPVTGPVRGFVAISRVVRQQAERELYDPDKIHEELGALANKHKAGELSDEDLAAREEELLGRLIISQERRNAER